LLAPNTPEISLINTVVRTVSITPLIFIKIVFAIVS
jgi:hypothetical protein